MAGASRDPDGHQERTLHQHRGQRLAEEAPAAFRIAGPGRPGDQRGGTGRHQLEGGIEQDQDEHRGADRRLGRHRHPLDEILVDDAITVGQHREGGARQGQAEERPDADPGGSGQRRAARVSLGLRGLGRAPH